jgi:hypothetical protein
MKDELERLRDARPAVADPSIELTRLARADLLRTVTRRASVWRAKRLAVVGVPAAAAIIAAVAISATMLTRGGDEAWAAALVNVAESAPRLLPDQPGWQVTHADEFNIQFGEMTFSQGQRELALRWQPASTYQGMLHKRAIEADLATSLPVAGTDARVFRDQGTEVFSALWERGGYAIELYDTARKLEDFNPTLGSFHEVDIDTWLSALPASVIKPANRAEVVNQMLAEPPLPPDSTSPRCAAAMQSMIATSSERKLAALSAVPGSTSGSPPIMRATRPALARPSAQWRPRTSGRSSRK